MIKVRLQKLLDKSNILINGRPPTLEFIAFETDIPENMLRDMLYDLACNPDLISIYKLCQFFECDVSDILEISDEPNPIPIPGAQ
ncbi:MAG: XRE family transcriptional regulator [Oceanococcus sp.]|nr:MAG: XRE family transcriptional regulator [Oceanococcus sp.]